MCDDICLLKPLTEDALVALLYQRYTSDQIHTWLGANVLLVLNPYRSLDHEDDDEEDCPEAGTVLQSKIKVRRVPLSSANLDSLSQRVMTTAVGFRQDSCVVFTGETSAGKTYCFQHVLQSFLCNHLHSTMTKKILASQVLLQVFGQVYMNKSQNATRFGQYLELDCDFTSAINSAEITLFKLDKYHVTSHAADESNYFIFYLFLQYAETNFLKSLHLRRNHDYYSILRCHSPLPEMSRETYLHILKAFESIYFNHDVQNDIFRILAAILLLSNLELSIKQLVDGSTTVIIHNESELLAICDLLHCDVHQLQSALIQLQWPADQASQPSAAGGGGSDSSEEFPSSSLPDNIYASHLISSLCQAIYHRLFLWLIDQINVATNLKAERRHHDPHLIGLLDYYGFQSKHENHFMEILINYMNEKIENFIVDVLLREAQEEYIREGLQWSAVQFVDNSVICSLLDKPEGGLFSVAERLVPSQSTSSITEMCDDRTVLFKFHHHFHSHPHYWTHHALKNAGHPVTKAGFSIQHFAGTTFYSADGFLECNSDRVRPHLSQCMFQCGHPLLKLLFPEGDPERSTLGKQPPATAKVKIALADLVRHLSTRVTYFVRCLRPNDQQKPRLFEETLVKSQITAFNVLNCAKIKQSGFAAHLLMNRFFRRYKCLCPQTWRQWTGSLRDGCKCVLDYLCIRSNQYFIGRTQVFIKHSATMCEVERLLSERMNQMACVVQNWWRGIRLRRRFLLMRKAQITIAKVLRGYLVRRSLVGQRFAASRISAVFKGWRVRTEFRQLQERRKQMYAAIIIAKYFRGWKIRRQFRTRFRRNAAPVVHRTVLQVLKIRFLLRVRDNLPTHSPLDKTWKVETVLFHEANEYLHLLFHHWRCRRFRAKFDDTQKSILWEKATAYTIFKHKKALYETSVPHPFRGDYIRIRQNTKWRKLSEGTIDGYVVFADIVGKINRTNGKMVPHFLIVTLNHFIIMDQRTMQIKYRLPVSEIFKISVSPFVDGFVLFHIRKNYENGDTLSRKGDVPLAVDHVFEVVAKVYLVVKNATNQAPMVDIAAQFLAEFNCVTTEIVFRPAQMESGILGQVRLSRKGNRFEVMYPEPRAKSPVRKT